VFGVLCLWHERKPRVAQGQERNHLEAGVFNTNSPPLVAGC
jgi:hypothetical protein